MRRWNGWGDDANDYAVPPSAVGFIEARLGKGRHLSDVSLVSVMAQVPASRLPPHPLLRIDAESRVRHARGQSLPDWLAMRSGDIGVFPDAVALPQSTQDVVDLLAYARQHDAIVIPYGGGTSVAGHINPLPSHKPVLTISLQQMNRLVDIDTVSQLATFGAGVAGPELEAQLRAHGFMLGHFPQSFELSTLGGWIAARSSGQQSLRYGRIEQLFAGGTVVTPQGVLQIPCLPASSAGPDLREFVLGSEGRLGIISEATVRISRLPQNEQFCVAFAKDWETGVAAMRELAQARLGLSMLRLSNARETETQLALAGKPQLVSLLEKYLAKFGAGLGKCMLTYGITGSDAQVRFMRLAASKILKAHGVIRTGQLLGKKWQHSRFRSPYLRESLWQLGYVVDTLETAINWERVPELVESIETALSTTLNNDPVHVFTHLSHVYLQGSSIYTTYVLRNADSYAQTLANWKSLKFAACAAIVAAGGTISHQHGVGKDHAPYLAAEKGELGMRMIRDMLANIDRDARLNPGTLLGDAGCDA
jgi:alkyldihydroxyacetonephosphate synthase